MQRYKESPLPPPSTPPSLPPGATHQDIATKYTALLFGITNACSSVSGTVAVYATGEILERTHDWNLVWTLSAGLLLAGNLAYVALGRNEKVLP